ncbi:MAG: AzlD domain-containing protein [Clostridia bacterium]|nr:AzlD domain-containing protein [Clostridia bacterium]MBR6783429.1 AzlD domain-containing protein [Clostridia bacterium]
MNSFWIYLLILAGSTYLIRAIPFAAVKQKITNRFVRSFLYYIPYTVLAAMTFPAALYATGNIYAAAAGLLVGAVFAVLEKGLTVVAVASCITVFAAEALL